MVGRLITTKTVEGEEGIMITEMDTEINIKRVMRTSSEEKETVTEEDAIGSQEMVSTKAEDRLKKSFQSITPDCSSTADDQKMSRSIRYPASRAKNVG